MRIHFSDQLTQKEFFHEIVFFEGTSILLAYRISTWFILLLAPVWSANVQESKLCRDGRFRKHDNPTIFPRKPTKSFLRSHDLAWMKSMLKCSSKKRLFKMLLAIVK